MNNRVSVIIITKDAESLLRQCLKSVLSQTYADLEVIVVDNASKDGSINMLKNEYPQVRVLQNYSNELYTKAANKGLSSAKGDYIMFLNNDVTLEPDYIKETLAMFFLDKRVGSVQGLVLSEDKTSIDSAGIFWAKSAEAKETLHKKSIASCNLKKDFMFGCCGAVAFYRRELIEQISEKKQFFDNKLEFYYEDIDVAIRAYKAGWLAYFTPNAVAYHKRGATAQSVVPKNNLLSRYSTPKLSKPLQSINLSNRLYIIKKHMNLFDFIKRSPWIALTDLRNLLYMLIFAPDIVKPTVKRTITLFKKSAENS